MGRIPLWRLTVPIIVESFIVCNFVSYACQCIGILSHSKRSVRVHNGIRLILTQLEKLTSVIEVMCMNAFFNIQPRVLFSPDCPEGEMPDANTFTLYLGRRNKMANRELSEMYPQCTTQMHSIQYGELHGWRWRPWRQIGQLQIPYSPIEAKVLSTQT